MKGSDGDLVRLSFLRVLPLTSPRLLILLATHQHLMTTLTVKHGHKDAPKVTYILHRELVLNGVERYNGSNFALIRDRFLHKGHSTVMRGALTGSSSYDGPTDVVCKWVVSNTERLKSEANLYVTKLAELQGLCVPRFVGSHEKDGDVISIACILLEYCGQRIQGWIGSYPMDFRCVSLFLESMRNKLISLCHDSMKTYHVLEEVHAAEIAHGDLEDDHRHFLARGDDIYLIDFDRSYNHECSRSQDVYPYDFEPTSSKFD